MLLHSLHHYACYCALLCLLQQQQLLTAALTVIIDGATTNEWATRDEYERLVDSSAPSAARADLGDLEQQQQPQPQQQQLSATDSDVRELAGRLQLGLLGQRDTSAAQAIEFALDRLEQFELQQRQQVQQQQHRRRHKQTHQPPAPQANPTVNLPLQLFAQEHQGPQKQVAPAANSQTDYLAAPALNELAPGEEDELALRPRPRPDKGPRRHRDVGTPRRYCGNAFIDVIELVCGVKGVYEGTPVIINPTVKMKRSTSRFSKRSTRQMKASEECCKQPCDEAQLLAYCNP